MNGGLINCSCGQVLYCETVNKTIRCIRCNKSHDVEPLPEPEPEVIEEETPEEGE